jgi:hypothetical protein
MSSRLENRKWLQDGAQRWPDGWEARSIDQFGIEGALDLLAAQEGHPFEVNLTHRPFAGNDELKALVRDARTAASELARISYQIWFEATRDET